ncbi:SIS domain-containing protein [Paenibacillus sanguinis]|uniref:SIS domain-containing protein n=1 Tax=Paenibacillus sanguinis TaxID=225906 RepID=UPI00036CFA9B|nr:SIS domain-containing protein [Paenibacillus sanguinis]
MTNKALPAFLNILQSEISNFIASIDEVAIEQARDLIFQAQSHQNRVHVTGIGKPSHVASYIASLLSSTGTPAYELNGTEAVHGSSGQVVPGDVVIAISNSGGTEELKATIQTLISNGAKIIAVTGNKDSWLANMGDVVLHAGVRLEGDPLNKPPRASVVAEIIMLQGLSILLQDERNLTPEQYVKWHPSGALGKLYKLK